MTREISLTNTVAIFKKHENKIIAILPRIPALNDDPEQCLTYSSAEGFGSIKPDDVAAWRRPTTDEIKNLHNLLTDLGYILEIEYKVTNKDSTLRRKTAELYRELGKKREVTS